MRLLDEILEYNKTFVETEEYRNYQTSRYPHKRLVILSCMDTRLVELLPKAMNLRNGDVKIVKNAGAVVSHPFGSAMRSILVAVYELGAEEVCVIGHHQCGMSNIDPVETVQKMRHRGVTEETISTLKYAGIDLNHWLMGFSSVEESVRNSVAIIRNHPLIPTNLPVHGLIIDPKTGHLDIVSRGYQD